MGHTLSIIVWGAIPALPSFLFNLTLPLMIGLPGVALLAQGRTRVWCMVGSIGCALVGVLLIVGLVAAVPLGRMSHAVSRRIRFYPVHPTHRVAERSSGAQSVEYPRAWACQPPVVQSLCVCAEQSAALYGIDGALCGSRYSASHYYGSRVGSGRDRTDTTCMPAPSDNQSGHSGSVEPKPLPS